MDRFENDLILNISKQTDYEGQRLKIVFAILVAFTKSNYIHNNEIKLPLEIMDKIYINIAYSNSTTNKQKFRLPLMCLKHDGHRKSYLTKCRISKAENKWRHLTLCTVY